MWNIVEIWKKKRSQTLKQIKSTRYTSWSFLKRTNGIESFIFSWRSHMHPSLRPRSTLLLRALSPTMFHIEEHRKINSTFLKSLAHWPRPVWCCMLKKRKYLSADLKRNNKIFSSCFICVLNLIPVHPCKIKLFTLF